MRMAAARAPLDMGRAMRLGLAIGLGAGLVMAAACGDGRDLPPLSNTGGGSSSGDGGSSGACVDGTVRECHVEIGQNGNVLSCLDGEELCQDGAWGPCEGDITARSVQSGPARGDGHGQEGDEGLPKPMALSDAGSCSNACDPTCQVFGEEPDGQTTPTPQVITLPGGDIRVVIPGGQTQKYLKEPCTSDCDCQADHYCDGVTQMCTPYGIGQTSPACPATPDYTTGVACNNKIPVCNRGGAAGAQPLIVYIQPGNCLQAQDPFCMCSGFGCNNPDMKCTLTQSIPAGQCLTISPADCRNCGNNGLCDGAVPGSFPNGVGATVVNSPDFPLTPPLPECRCDNNWGVMKDPGNACPTVNAYEPLTYKENYTAVCPQGSYPQWGYLAYTSLAPTNASGGTSIVIRAQSAATVGALSPTCAGCVDVASVPASHPAICPLAGPSPCPRNIYTALGGPPSTSYAVLQLEFTLNPTPDKKLAPTVTGWQLTYSCVPSE